MRCLLDQQVSRDVRAVFMPLFERFHIEAVQVNRTEILDTLLPGINLMSFEDLQGSLADRHFFVSVNLSVHISVFHLHTDASHSSFRVPSSLMQFVEPFHHLDHLVQGGKAEMPVQGSDPILRLLLPHS